MKEQQRHNLVVTSNLKQQFKIKWWSIGAFNSPNEVSRNEYKRKYGDEK